jgi:hypothetical protein
LGASQNLFQILALTFDFKGSGRNFSSRSAAPSFPCCWSAGVFDMISLKLADSMGFELLYMTGYGTVASLLGLPDAGLATYTDMVGRVAVMAGMAKTPLIADGDTGYGGLLNVRHTVRGYELRAPPVSSLGIRSYLMQAEAGYLSLTGEPDGPPSRAGLSLVDLSTGTTAAMVLLAGVIDAMKTGQGRDLDVSLYDAALHQVLYLGTWYLNGGAVTHRQPRSSHPSLTPSQLYKTKDGWIFVMCQKEKFWRILCNALGHPEWIENPDLRPDQGHRLARTGIWRDLADRSCAGVGARYR